MSFNESELQRGLTNSIKVNRKSGVYSPQVVKCNKTKVGEMKAAQRLRRVPLFQPYWVKCRQMNNGIKASSLFPLVVDKSECAFNPGIQTLANYLQITRPQNQRGKSSGVRPKLYKTRL